MNWLTDRFIFYAGVAVVIFAFFLTIIFILISRIRFSKIKHQLIKEYGESCLKSKEKK